MNILLINGSPRGERSNTLKIARAFVNGLTASGDATVIEITVRDRKIMPCTGCFSCWKATPGKCIYRDDMDEIHTQLLASDIVIWSFPLYFFGMPSGIKALMDRQLPLLLPFMDPREDGGVAHPSRYPNWNPRHVLISSAGFCSRQNNYEGLLRQFEIFTHGDLTAILCPEGELLAQPALNSVTTSYLETVNQAGREFAQKGKVSAQTNAALEKLFVQENVYREMADLSWGVEDTRKSIRPEVETQDPHGTERREALIFTRQMATLYRPQPQLQHDLILEMNYTDVDVRVQLWLSKDGCKVESDEASFKEATTLITTPLSVWKAIAANEITGPRALAEGKYKVSGDFSLMVKWDDYFGSETRNASGPTTANAAVQALKPNMLCLLMPWIALWSVLPFNAQAGAIIGILLGLLMPLLGLKFRLTVYDRLSGFLVGALSLGALMGMSNESVIVLSYLLFGAMWFGSCYLNIPLTAHYSLNDYGGDKALENPLFIDTNRILSTVWGVYYLLFAAVAFILNRAGQINQTAIISIVAPILLGIFTAWFQRWYPAKIARG